MIVVPVIVFLVILMLVGNQLWQDTIGNMHPVVWLAEILGLMAAYHIVIKLADRFLAKKEK